MDIEETAAVREALTQVIENAPAGQFLARLAAYGWRELLAHDPVSAVSLVATLQGTHLSDASAIDQAVAGLEWESGTRFVFPPPGRAVPSSRVVEPTAHTTIEIELHGVVTTASSTPPRVVAPARRGSELVVLVGRPVTWPDTGSGLEPDSGWARLAGPQDLREVEVIEGADAADIWLAIRLAGYRFLAHELVGIGSALLDMTVAHVLERRQFGRALGEFQVVKHKLADTRAWLEAARLSAEASWEDGDLASGLVAKILTSRFSSLARLHGQQLIAGRSFSLEHPFHGYLRRGLLLESLLGGTEELRSELGERMRTAGALPRLARL